MSRWTRIELCVTDPQGVKIARDVGADRVELCKDISCGGLTTPWEDICESLLNAPPGGVMVLVRCRPGNFIYSPEEIDTMASCIDDIVCSVEKLSRDYPDRAPVGFVVGAVDGKGSIDRKAAQLFRDITTGYELTFHRAFDTVDDLDQALKMLNDMGYDRILTTGGNPQKANGSVLARLVNESEKVTILASGGLRADNVADILRQTQAQEVHMRAPAEDPERTDPRLAADIVYQIRKFDQG